MLTNHPRDLSVFRASCSLLAMGVVRVISKYFLIADEISEPGRVKHGTDRHEPDRTNTLIRRTDRNEMCVVNSIDSTLYFKHAYCQ